MFLEGSASLGMDLEGWDDADQGPEAAFEWLVARGLPPGLSGFPAYAGMDLGRFSWRGNISI